MGFDLRYFPAIGAGDQGSMSLPTQAHSTNYPLGSTNYSPGASGGPSCSPQASGPGAASTGAVVAASHSQTPPPWPKRTGKHLWHVCPHRVQRGW